MVDNNKKKSSWDTESALDMGTTLEDMIEEEPFKEASDESGNSVTAGSRVPMWLHRRVVKLRELSNSPYDVNSDVYRDAIYQGLHVLHMRYGLSVDWGVDKQMAAVVDATTAGVRVRNQVEELVKGLDELKSSGEEGLAVESLEKYVAAANELTDNWRRERVLKLLAASRSVREFADSCSVEVRAIIYGRKTKKRDDSTV